MFEIPKIVRSRLAVQAQESHPDPNQLSAFVEQSLPGKERVDVLRHLSSCADCREIVILSAPEVTAALPHISPHPGSAWLRWPVLRWSAGLAALVIVGTAVSLHYNEIKEPQQSARLGGSEEVALMKTRPAAPASEPASNLTGNEVQQKPGLKRSLAEKQLDPAAKEGEEKSQARNELDANIAAATPAAAPSSMAKARRSDAPSVTVEAGALATMDQTIPGKAKDALQDAYMPDPVRDMAAANESQPVARSMLPLVPRWTLTADGTLQRSLDSGRSWQRILVSRNATIRALAANGMDIWVGGVAGTLYHSSDAGEHWVPVQPSSNGHSLSADIIGMEFPDLQHGRLNTSSGEVWTTQDAGLTWSQE